MGKLKEFLVLLRIHTAAVTAEVFLIGAFLSAPSIKFLTVVCLFVIGVLIHIAGFSLNEIMDLKYDMKSLYHKHKPLVSGAIDRSEAVKVFLTLFLLYLLIYYLFFRSLSGLVIIIILSLSGVTYNILGKKLPFSDGFAAMWFALLPFAGVLAISRNLPPALPFLAFYLFFQILYNNSVEGGLKDLETDFKSGAVTTLIYLGLKSRKSLRGPPFIYSVVVRAALFISPLIPLFVYNTIYNIEIKIFIVLFALSLFLLSLKTLVNPPKKRKNLLKEFTIHEVGSFLLFLCLIYPYIEVKIFLSLAIIPPVWNVFFNKIMYGTLGIPKV